MTRCSVREEPLGSRRERVAEAHHGADQGRGVRVLCQDRPGGATTCPETGILPTAGHGHVGSMPRVPLIAIVDNDDALRDLALVLSSCVAQKGMTEPPSEVDCALGFADELGRRVALVELDWLAALAAPPARSGSPTQRLAARCGAEIHGLDMRLKIA